MLAQDLANRFRSVSIIGLGKNTGKTFTFNYLLRESRRLGLSTAITSIGLDGEERDTITGRAKPQVVVYPGQIVLTASPLLTASSLDYEVLAATGIASRLGEIIIVRAMGLGRVVLAGPSNRSELEQLQEKLEPFPHDLLLVDGAFDRRSLSAPAATDTTILAVGTEAAWDREDLLGRLKLQWQLLTLSALDNQQLLSSIETIPNDAKLVVFCGNTPQHIIYHSDSPGTGGSWPTYTEQGIYTIFVPGMLTDGLLAQVLPKNVPTSLTLLVPDATHLFLSRRSLDILTHRGVSLKVLRQVHISAVTVNPYSSRFGCAEPLSLLQDVGRVVEPVPCYDLNLGLRYVAKEDADAVSHR